MNIKLNIILTILGTFVGAGFISGKEINMFFVRYGIEGFISCELAIFIITLFIYFIIEISKYKDIKTNEEFNNEILKNKNMRKQFNKTINIFLLSCYYVMETGLCSFIKEINNIPIFVTAIINALIVYSLIKNRINGLVTINLLAVPIIILFIIDLIINQIGRYNYLIFNNNIKYIGLIKSGINSFIFVGYNLLILIPILVTFSEKIKNKKELNKISIIIFVVLNIIILGMFIVLYNKNINLKEDFPILVIQKNNILRKKCSIFVIILSIITSELSAIYGNIQNYLNTNIFNKNLIIKLILGIFIAFIGFGNLIKIVYPVFGIIGVIVMFFVLKYYSIAKINKN